MPIIKQKEMGAIILKNIKIYAYHGCLMEEGKIGSDYRIDLKIFADLDKSAQTDDLRDTVNYVHLNKIVSEEMAVRAKLLETVGKRIIDRILNELPLADKVHVLVSKINPPIGGDVAMVTIEMERKR
jgi:7,8-dihydroneopterin aldolase/epimerase/oxygenase